MSYENRIYFVARSSNTEKVFGRRIAMMDISNWTSYSKYPIRDIFKEEIKYDTYLISGDNPTKEDRYGVPLRETSVDNLIDYLEKEIPTEENECGYKASRLRILLAMAKAIKDEGKFDYCGEVVCIHFGY